MSSYGSEEEMVSDFAADRSTGLAFIAYWGIVLFGYDTLVCTIVS